MTVKSIHFKNAPQRANHFSPGTKPNRAQSTEKQHVRGEVVVVARGEEEEESGRKTWPALIRQIIGTETTEP